MIYFCSPFITLHHDAGSYLMSRATFAWSGALPAQLPEERTESVNPPGFDSGRLLHSQTDSLSSNFSLSLSSQLCPSFIIPLFLSFSVSSLQPPALHPPLARSLHPFNIIGIAGVLPAEYAKTASTKQRESRGGRKRGRSELWIETKRCKESEGRTGKQRN
ncbi:unnamed protein product [Pleuronectes platessa]|uniref:Uncharacterized protein n=1 Tax=Pleuronectes platessa TaxID=8262 RepID=A0A9N7USW3_PLEPL|nr:unnamed protein product [Pleuronectes platessa]